MRIRRAITNGCALVAAIALFSSGMVHAQAPISPRLEHTKVPSFSRGSETLAEPAPTFEESINRLAQSSAGVNNAPKRSPRHKHAVQQAAYHQPMMQSNDFGMEQIEPMADPYDFNGGGGGGAPCDGNCATPCGSSCCSPCCPDPCNTAWENLQVFGGVEGFKSAVDQGVNGNFGFHEGVNWGGALFEYGGIGGQLGAQAVQSNLGESFLFEDNRIQFFLTTGLFHRPMNNNGWQGGVVWDWLHDDYYAQMDVSQIRGELSWLSCGHHEVGFWTAIGTTSDTEFSSFNDEDVTWQPIDMYSLFYRRYFENGSIGRFSAGFTGDGQGLLGADLLAPLTPKLALVTNVNYILGRNDPAPEEALTESWGLTISLVWYPGYKSPCSSRNPYRPIFGVADNTTMMLNYRGPSFD